MKVRFVDAAAKSFEAEVSVGHDRKGFYIRLPESVSTRQRVEGTSVYLVTFFRDDPVQPKSNGDHFLIKALPPAVTGIARAVFSTSAMLSRQFTLLEIEFIGGSRPNDDRFVALEVRGISGD